MFNKFKDWGDNFYLIFRIVIGFLFFQNGAKKMFGWFGGSAQPFASMIGVAGTLEVIIGIVLILGIFVRLAALIGALEMIVAYAMVHIPKGIDPMQNGGEKAILYLVIFLILLAYGAGKWSLGKKIWGEEKL